jgi:hypothetical protein
VRGASSLSSPTSRFTPPARFRHRCVVAAHLIAPLHGPTLPPPAELAGVIETINTSLREVELKLDSTASAGSKSWAVVDASSNATQELGDDSVWSLTNPGPSSRHATTYTRPQLEMYNKIVEAAIESESGSVSEIECVNFRNDTKGKKMTGPEAEVFLSQLCQAGWLQRGTGQRARGRRRMDIAALTDGGDSDGGGGGEDTAFDGVRLGVRSMIDLRTFLSNAVTVPEPPSIERVEVEGGLGEGVAHVHFSAGGSEGGAPVTGFVVTVSGGSGGKLTVSGKQSPITVSNLGPGRYTFTVKALNLGGTRSA